MRNCLDAQFLLNPYPGENDTSKLSTQTGISTKTIKTWFANARTRKAAKADLVPDVPTDVLSDLRKKVAKWKHNLPGTVPCSLHRSGSRSSIFRTSSIGDLAIYRKP